MISNECHMVARARTLLTSQSKAAQCLRLCLVLLPVLFQLVPVSVGHPQCLDSSTPGPANLTMCTQYAAFGCCSLRQEADLTDLFDAVKHRLRETDWERCRQYVKDLLCQKCAPMAAHMFDADLKSLDHPRALPGLCKDYCQAFYTQCRDVVWFLDYRLASSSSFGTQNTFCEQIKISDMGYCYPNVTVTHKTEESEADEDTATTQEGCLCLKPVLTGLANPIFARHAGDNSGRLFVGEQRGLVYIMDPGSKELLPTPFLNISNKILLSYRFGDERGLGGLAFHPKFSENGRVFVYYNVPLFWKDRRKGKAALGVYWDHKVRLSEMRVLPPSNPDVVDPHWEKVLLEVNEPYANHNGGEMFFRDDGYLYLFLGDGGYAGDPHNLAQNKSWLLGKVLRLDVDHPSDNTDRAYAIPPDNPFVDQGPQVRPEIFAYGVRNIWRCGVDMGDQQTGSGRDRVLCGDVGQSLYEEIDLLKKGANYGWRAREGYECYDEDMCNHIGVEELPVHVYNHSVGQSVTGGQFYRGCLSPALNGKYIYGDYQSRRLFTLEETTQGQWNNSDVTMCGTEVCTQGLTNVVDKYILSFGQDQQGEVYMLTSTSSQAGKTDGAVYQFVDPFSDKTSDDCKAHG